MRSRASGHAAAPLWVVLAAATGYALWLGLHWLPLDYNDKELAAMVSRVWDIRRELLTHFRLPWWTPLYMGGSSYAPIYAQSLYLGPWLLLSGFTDLATAGKLLALGALWASAPAMYFCARHFLGSSWAAALSALAYLLFPQQLARAGGTEHIGLMLAFPLIPLVWLCFARALESGAATAAVACALVAVGLALASYKQALVQAPFLLGYLGYWLWGSRERWRGALRSCALIAAWALALGAASLVPALTEGPLMKGLSEKERADGQQLYAFHSFLGLVDRNGVATRSGLAPLEAQLARHPLPEDDAGRAAETLARGLRFESPEKYAGLVLLAMIGVTALCGRQRANRGLFWLLFSMWGAALALAMGPQSVWARHAQTLATLLAYGDLTRSLRLALLAPAVVGAGFVALLFWRKLRSPRSALLGAAALAAFLWLPAFACLSRVPPFGLIRAPYSFYDLPGALLAALLAGFFLTDVVRARGRTAAVWVCAVLLLMLADTWPYQEAMKSSDIPARKLANLRASYAELARDRDPVKAYAMPMRVFHLLGPMWSGKPQAWEFWTSWMAPEGTALLHGQAWESIPSHRAFVDLIGAGYLVADKTDRIAPEVAQRVEVLWRRRFPVALENDDFAVFRNPGAWPLVQAFERACLYVGDLERSPKLSLLLARRGYPLVHAAGPEDLRRLRPESFERVYQLEGDGDDSVELPRAGTPLPGAVADLERESHQRLRFTTDTPRESWIVVNESYYPYWRAQVDGRPVEVLRVSTGLMGLRVPAGRHRVELRYQPPRRYAVAAAISGVALLAAAWVLWRGRR